MSSPAWGGGWWDGRRAIAGYQAVVGSHWAFDDAGFPPEGITGGAATPVIGYETDGVRLERKSDPPRLAEYRKGLGAGRAGPRRRAGQQRRPPAGDPTSM